MVGFRFLFIIVNMLSKREEHKEGSPKMWDTSGDVWDSFDGAGSHKVASLSYNEPNIQAAQFTDDDQDRDEMDTIPIS